MTQTVDFVDDDILTEAQLESAGNLADSILDDIDAEIFASDEDPDAVYFALFVTLSRILAENGWSPEELSEAARTHAEIQTTEGSA